MSKSIIRSVSLLAPFSLVLFTGACGPDGGQTPTAPERTGSVPPPQETEAERYPEIPEPRGPTEPGLERADVSPMTTQVMGEIQQVNMMEIRLAQLAQEKAENDQVRTLAAEVLDDHRRASERVAALAQDLGVRPTIPSPDEQEQQTMERLQRLEGKEFDRAFLEAMAMGHERTIERLQEAQDEVDEELADIIDQLVPTLTEHREMAEGLLRQAPAA